MDPLLCAVAVFGLLWHAGGVQAGTEGCVHGPCTRLCGHLHCQLAPATRTPHRRPCRCRPTRERQRARHVALGGLIRPHAIHALRRAVDAASASTMIHAMIRRWDWPRPRGRLAAAAAATHGRQRQRQVLASGRASSGFGLAPSAPCLGAWAAHKITVVSKMRGCWHLFC